MPAEGGEVGAVESVVGVHEGVEEIVRAFGDVALDDFRRVNGDLMFRPEGFLRFRIVDDLQPVIVDLDAVGICPHLVLLIASFLHDDVPLPIVLQHSDLHSIAYNVLQGQR